MPSIPPPDWICFWILSQFSFYMNCRFLIFLNHPWNSTNGTWNLYYYKNHFLSPNSFWYFQESGGKRLSLQASMFGTQTWAFKAISKGQPWQPRVLWAAVCVCCAGWAAVWSTLEAFCFSVGVFCSSVLLSTSFWNFLQNLSLDPTW